jgi:uncharacterized protein YqfB (UPF0267 family)
MFETNLSSKSRKFKIFLLVCLSIILLIPFFVKAETILEDEKALIDLKNETLSYFEPVTGKITGIDNDNLIVEISDKKKVNIGTRLNAFKEGVSFIHPITKEEIGKVEIPVGMIEIVGFQKNHLLGKPLKGKIEDYLNSNIKIPATKKRLLFVQGNVDWFLADSYYEMLKQTGRFELVDTGVDPQNISDIISEAKNKSAEIILILQSNDINSQLKLTQILLWTDDSKQFSQKDVFIDSNYVKELRTKTRFFVALEKEAMLTFKLPLGSKNIAIGDIDGDGISEIILPSSNTVRIYKLGVDLKLFNEFKVKADEILWLDTIDSNKNKKDEIIITGLKDDSVISYIYEYKDTDFTILYNANDHFIRKLDNDLIIQGYSKQNGYEGDIYYLSEDSGTYKKDGIVKLPSGINIYDFQLLVFPDKRKVIFLLDDNGYLHLYDGDGIKLWISKEDYGGFVTKFKKESLSPIVEKGYWYIKDKLITRNNEILVIKRKPLLSLAKGIGYKSSEIKSFWWNGMSVEEKSILGEIGGEILDFAVSGEKLYIVVKPLFGINFKNILKGENPFTTMLYIYSLKGR